MTRRKRLTTIVPSTANAPSITRGRIGLRLLEWRDKLADPTVAARRIAYISAPKRKENGRWVDTGVPGLGGGLQFIHPVSGEKVPADFPIEEEALRFCHDGFPDFAGIGDLQLRFWLIWRLWRHYRWSRRAKRFALGLAGLPADTRIPDASIWHHDAVVSALEAARDAEGRFCPAFLLFQIGPVQEFIAQARSTRDAWSGSYLISWMMAHAMKMLADKLGPDCVIYPSLRGLPLYDWLEQEKLKSARHQTRGEAVEVVLEETNLRECQDLALTPNLPNRFLAVVPAEFDVKQLETVFSADGWDSDKPDAELSEWARIVGHAGGSCPRKTCRKMRRTSGIFRSATSGVSLGNFVRGWRCEASMDLFKTIPLGRQSPLHLGRDIALTIPTRTRTHAATPRDREDRKFWLGLERELPTSGPPSRRSPANPGFFRLAVIRQAGPQRPFLREREVIATAQVAEDSEHD